MIQDTSQLYAIIASAVTGVVLLIKIIEKLVSFIIKKMSKDKDEKELIKEVLNYLESSNTSVLTDDEKNQLQTLYNLHNKFDENGLPVWYDKSFISNNKLLDVLEKINDNQLKLSLLLEKIKDEANNTNK